jgi:hypothetical protein
VTSTPKENEMSGPHDTDTCDCTCPDTLELWHERVKQYVAWEKTLPPGWFAFTDAEGYQNYKTQCDDWFWLLDDAWDRAPLRDRARMRCRIWRMDWESLKKAWRKSWDEGKQAS